MKIKERLNHIGSVLIFAPIIIGIDIILYASSGSKINPKEQLKFIWSLMWSPIDGNECNIYND